MTKNMGWLDRAVRLVVAAVLVLAAFSGGFAATGAVHWLALAVAAIMVLTALVGSCPLYGLVGIRTCRSR
ncbi:YgaP family membrane protein [Amorphus coralli]|uniref:YgaP family membrane protein n=1 Tax=Amorphus coralli TaxID=340680 RepID=UPI0003707214|nr:DUF2892 domain-containing protein [Amorphus coralli]